MPSRLFFLSSLNETISILRDVWLVFLSPCFIYIPVLNANNVDPDQKPRSAASDQSTLFANVPCMGRGA